jgi:hypothetical protein
MCLAGETGLWLRIPEVQFSFGIIPWYPQSSNFITEWFHGQKVNIFTKEIVKT